MNASDERYSRQVSLDNFGLEAQEKLAKAKVLVIGAGGLGCPLLQYLVAAGVGHIGLADDDVVSLSNLNRQILFGQEDVGQLKVEVAKRKLLALNDQVIIKTWAKRWNQGDCINHFKFYDIIVDATDNFATRYLINDACVLLNKPLVYGAVSKFEGQVAVFNYKNVEGEISTNYRDIFPEIPKNHEVLNCAEAGVLGILPGIIGVMQASEVIKIITKKGEVLANKMLLYNSLNQDFYTLKLQKNPEALKSMPETINAFLQTDYNFLCEYQAANYQEIDVEEWYEMKENALLVDVRDISEKPKLDDFIHLAIPLSELERNFDKIAGQDIVFICQSGKRSIKAAALASEYSPKSKIYSLKGGVNTLLQ